MTFADAALKVLKQADRPMHYREITDVAIEEKLLDHVGQSPYQTMNSRLAMLSRIEEEKRVVVKVRPGIYSLDKLSPALVSREDLEKEPVPPLKPELKEEKEAPKEEAKKDDEPASEKEASVDKANGEATALAANLEEEKTEDSTESQESELEASAEESDAEANEDVDELDGEELEASEDTDLEEDDDSAEKEEAGQTQYPRIENFQDQLVKALEREKKPISVRRLAQKIFQLSKGVKGLSVSNLVHQFHEELKDKSWENIQYSHGKVFMNKGPGFQGNEKESLAKKPLSKSARPEKPRLGAVYLQDEVDKFYLHFQEQSRKLVKHALVKMDAYDFKSACQAVLSVSGCEDIAVRPKISGADVCFLVKSPLESNNGLAVGYKGSNFQELMGLLKQLKLNLAALGLRYAYVITMMENMDNAQKSLDEDDSSVHITLVGLDKIAHLFQKKGAGAERHELVLDIIHKDKLFHWIRTFG